MTDIEKYKIFLIEQYRTEKSLTARDTYNLFEKHGIFDYIEETFEALHTLDTAEVVADIETLIKNH